MLLLLKFTKMHFEQGKILYCIKICVPFDLFQYIFLFFLTKTRLKLVPGWCGPEPWCQKSPNQCQSWGRPSCSRRACSWHRLSPRLQWRHLFHATTTFVLCNDDISVLLNLKFSISAIVFGYSCNDDIFIHDDICFMQWGHFIFYFFYLVYHRLWPRLQWRHFFPCNNDISFMQWRQLIF